MSYPLYDFENLHDESFRAEVKKRLSKIVDDSTFVEGPWNEMFEKGFAKLQGAPYCLLVANGTDALEIALKAQGVCQGDKVGVPGITFYATAEAVLNIGAVPVFIDVLPDTGVMCSDSFERMVKKHQLKAVMPVHIYGLPVNMEKVIGIAKEYGVSIVEDAAQACGTFYSNGKPVGSNRESLTTFSFYPTKNLSAMGDAGAITTHDPEMVERIKSIRNHGRGGVGVIGRNSRCDHMQAAILHLKLEKIEQYNQQRKEVAGWYHQGLTSSGLKLLPEESLKTSSWHLYPVHLESSQKRQALQDALEAKGVSCAPYYLKSMNMEEALKNYEGEHEIAQNLAEKVLCLPINPFLKESEVKDICSKVMESL